MISEQDIQNFQAIYKKNFGKEISQEEAYTQGIKLITLMKNIYRPIPKDFELKD